MTHSVMHLQHINFFISSLFMFCSNPKTRIFAIVASPRFLFCGRDYNLLLRTSLAEIALFVASGANSTTASRKEIRSLCRRQLASSMSSAQEETNREDKIGLGYRYLDGESESDSEDKFSRPLVICGPSGVGKVSSFDVLGM